MPHPTSTSSPNTASNKPMARALVLGGRMRHFDQPRSYATSDVESTDGAVRRRAGGDNPPSGVTREVLNEKRHSTTIELSHIDQEGARQDSKNEITELKDDKHGLPAEDHIDPEAVAVRTWTDRLHGQRPDRHLFPYRSMKDNLHAARTFLRRFFLILLIVPAWVIPNVLLAKANHKLESQLAGVGESNSTALHGALDFAGLKYVTLAESSGGEEHGPDLGKVAYWAIFLLNMFAMMHLGKAAGAALEELVPKFGMSVVSVFDAMTSSTVELACAAFALQNKLVHVVQAAMLGAILNNLLLMMGAAILIGGISNHEQSLKKETTQTSINILMITCIAYVIPIGLDKSMESIYKETLPELTTLEIRDMIDHDILKLSKIMSIILLIVYFACLGYQYHSRTFMVTPEAKHEGQHTVEKRYTHFWFAAFAYVATMAAQIYSAKLLVYAVENLGRAHHLSDSFVGFVLLPIVLIADLQEEVIAIRESRANRIDKAVALMVGSCMQIALLVTPILVILGWIMDVPMTFRFTILEVTILAASVLVISYLLSDHSTNWMEGVMLLAVFTMCAIAFYYDNSHSETTAGEGATLGGEVGAPEAHV